MPLPYLSYSANVHKSDTLADQYEYLTRFLIPLGKRIHGPKPIPACLRLGAPAVSALWENDEKLKTFDALLEANHLRVHALNGFPYGEFHGHRVKENVYLPDWTSEKRLDYTKKLCSLLSRWSPKDVFASVSTLAGKMKNDKPCEKQVLDFIAEQFAETALHCHRLEEKTGKKICLSLEPEPYLICETTEEFIGFYENHILRHGEAILKKRDGMYAEKAGELLRRHLNLCLDVCHLAVEFEDIGESVNKLTKRGIALGQVQITSALRVKKPWTDEKIKALLNHDEQRYLHQTFLTDSDGKITRRFLDLGNFAEYWKKAPQSEKQKLGEIRSHYHLPLFRETFGSQNLLETTSDLTAKLLLECEPVKNCPNHVIETYTWDLMALGPEELLKGLEEEFRWTIRIMEKGREHA